MARVALTDDNGGLYGAPATWLDGRYTTKTEAVRATDVANSAFLVEGTKVALGGDSITDGAGSTNASVDSYRAYLPKILGDDRANIVEHGVPGESAAGLRARMPAIVAENPGVIVMMIGTNASTSLTQYKSDVTAILDMARDARIPAVVALVPASGAGRANPVDNQTRTNVYNMFLRHIAGTRGIPVADTFAATVDPLTGYLRTGYDHDGTHPTPAGHLAVAKAVAAALDRVLPTPPAMVTAPGSPGLVANPLMTATTGTSPDGWGLAATPATGSTAATSAVDPVPGDGLTAGKWMKLDITAPAEGGSNYMRHHTISPTPAPGDVLLITSQVKADEAAVYRHALQLTDGASVVSIPGQNFGVHNPGTVRRTYTVPAGGFTGTPRIRATVSPQAGEHLVAYFGELQVYNLTQLGLTEIA